MTVAIFFSAMSNLPKRNHVKLCDQRGHARSTQQMSGLQRNEQRGKPKEPLGDNGDLVERELDRGLATEDYEGDLDLAGLGVDLGYLAIEIG